MDIDSFDPELKTKLDRAARMYNRGRITDEYLDTLLGEVQTASNDKKYRLGELKILLNNITQYKDDRKEVFNPFEGLISNFVVDGKPATSITDSMVTKTNRDKFLEAVNNARKINVTLEAAENKDLLINELNDVLNKKTEIGKDLLDDEEKKAIEILIERLSIIDTESPKGIAEIPEFKTLELLEKSLVSASVISTESREKYYDYWKGIENKFMGFDSFVGAVDEEARRLALIIQQNLGNRNFVEVKDEASEVYKDLKELTTNAYLPSYIIKCTPLKIKSDGPENQALELFRDFFSMIGREIPEQYKPKRDVKEAEAQIDATARLDYDAETGKESPSFDPTVADDIVDEIESAQKEIDDAKIDKYTDPLFALLIRNKETKGEYDDSVIEEAKKIIKKELTFETMGAFQSDLEKIINDELDNYLTNFKESRMVQANEFHIPMLDDELAKKYFDMLEGTFTVSYFIEGQIKEENFRKYSEAINFINKGMRNFFTNLGKFLKLVNAKQKVPERPKSRGGKDTFVQYLGGIVNSLMPKKSKVDLERLEEIPKVMELISEFHVKPLTSNMVLLEDVPEWFTSKEFKTFPSLVASSNVNMIRRSMSEGTEPIVEVDDLNKLSKFLDTIKNPNEIVYTTSMNSLFSDALDAYIKFFAAVDTVVGEESNELDDIIERTEILFGASLYDIASATESSQELEEIIFEGEPLSVWNDKQNESNVSIEPLISLLNSDEWENYVNTSGLKIRGFKSASDRLTKKLLESDIKLTGPITHAMLEATDIIRKMNDKKIYHANLDISEIDDIKYVSDMIKKENNIDLYGIDIYNITKSQSSFNDIAETYGFSTEIIYKVKGMFR
jgi:hypothetical protein|tara:strand:- start:800 stop:3340 length:2541 start_codon:yes stop_codon:yes gene_type:complete